MKVEQCIVFISLLMSATCMMAQNASDTTQIIKEQDIDEVVVTGARVGTLRNQISSPISVVHRSAIEQSGQTAILPLLSQQIPGLFVTERGMSGYGVSGGAAGGISMRGFSGGSGRVLILIDGHPQYAGIYGHPVSDSYIGGDIERVEVSRGATSVLYGSNAMGGAINLITRKAHADGNHLHGRLIGGSYGTQRYLINDSYKHGRLSAFVGANYDRTDGHRPNSAFNSLSGFAKIGYDISAAWRVSANINIDDFTSENPGEENNPMLDGKADVLRGMSALSVENNYENTSGAVNFYYNWGKHDINDGYHAGETPRPYLFKSTDYMSGVNVYQSISAFNGNTITAGFDLKLYGGDAYRNPETEVYADDINLHEVAGYLAVKQDVWRFTINGGLRLENHQLYGNEWVPQAGLSYRVSDATHLKFSASKGFRTPNLRELYMYAPANENLEPETSVSYDFTAIQTLFKRRLNVELNLFYTKGSNIVQVVRVDGRPQNQNVGEFTNKGVELSANYQVLANLRFNANYSYLHMNTEITGAPRHKFYAGANYAPGNFTFSAGVQLIDKLYLSTGDNAKTDSYTLVDMRAGYRPAKWIEIFAKGDNLFAVKYETMLGFPMPKTTVIGGLSFDI